MNYPHGGGRRDDPHNGNIGFEDETAWEASDDAARLEEEEDRRLESAIEASLAKILSLNGHRGGHGGGGGGGGDRDDSFHVPLDGGRRVSEDPYNGHIETASETQWRASTYARMQQEEREFEIMMALSMRGTLSPNGPRGGGGDRNDSIHSSLGDGSHVGAGFLAREAAMQPTGKYTCPKCDLDCSSQAELGVHMDMHQYAFDVGWEVRTDKRDVARKYPCAQCDNVFDSAYDAARHRAMHESTWDYGWGAHRERNKEKIVTCKKCYRSFLTARELENHVLRIHS